MTNISTNQSAHDMLGIHINLTRIQHFTLNNVDFFLLIVEFVVNKLIIKTILEVYIIVL